MNDDEFADYVHHEIPTLISKLSRLAVGLGVILLALGLGIILVRPWLDLERGPCLLTSGAACPNLWESIIAIFILVFLGLALSLLVTFIQLGLGFIRRHAQAVRYLVIGAGFFALALFTLVLSIQLVQWLLTSR